MERRFDKEARIIYHNIELSEMRAEHAEIIAEIKKRGLLYPVTVVDGALLHDGAVSYPVIMRAVSGRLLERQTAEA